jgi:hypothetical protein
MPPSRTTKIGGLKKKLPLLNLGSSLLQRGFLFEVARSALDSLAFLTFGDILNFAIFKNSFHLDFTAT